MARIITVAELQSDMTIIERAGHIPVKNVEHGACGPTKTHVNGTMCYDSGAEILVGKKV